MQDQKMLKTKDIMVRLGVSRATVRALIRRGDLPAVRVTQRCLRVTEADFAEFVSMRCSGHAVA